MPAWKAGRGVLRDLGFCTKPQVSGGAVRRAVVRFCTLFATAYGTALARRARWWDHASVAPAASRRPAMCSGGAIRGASRRYPGDVTKRLIEVDDDQLDAVRALLGTRTLKGTVSEAFDEVLALDQRRRALLAERGVDADLLADPASRRDAWG